MTSRFVVVDGVRTHYLEGGEGPIVVLWHSGEWGACARFSWEYTIPALASRYRVVAPDWLGFGETDKLYDFAGGLARRLAHMKRFLEVMSIERAAFIGNSMGGTVLARVAAMRDPGWPIAAIVLASAGGDMPDNAARRLTLDYDGTVDNLRRILSVFFYDHRWVDDERYIARRHAQSVAPGAWEAVAAARFHSPVLPPRTGFGQLDTTPYEEISVPTLIVAGADDRLREPGYEQELHGRVPGSRVVRFERCGHLPQIERADEFNTEVLAFLDDVFEVA